MTNMKMTNQESGFGALVDNLWGKLTGHEADMRILGRLWSKGYAPAVLDPSLFDPKKVGKNGFYTTKKVWKAHQHGSRRS